MIAIAAALAACGGDEPEGPENGEKTEKVTVHFGVNLSGGEFGGRYPGIDGQHYGYPETQCLDYFKAKGLLMVRLPFRWERIQRTMNGALVADEISKIKSFVQAAQDRGMYVILDMHNFGRYCIGDGTDVSEYLRIGTPQISIANYCDVWKKLAAEFKNYTCIWAYDIMNEPYGMLANVPWRDIAQEAINAIRTVDTKTMIMVSGDSYSSASRWQQVSDNLKTLTDPNDNLIFQAHVYFDQDAGGTYEGTYEQEGASANVGVQRLTPFVNWLKTNKKRGFVGEYGVPAAYDGTSYDARWSTVLENALKYLQDNGVNGTYWSAGQRWGTGEIMAIQPLNNYTVDRPQMTVLTEYKTAQQTVYIK